jgi:hypothetical protein
MLSLLFVALLQTPTTANLPTTGIALDILRPQFNTVETSLLSVAVYASGRAAVGPAGLVFELPFFRVDPNPGGPTSTLGNPYVGVEFGRGSHTRVSATAGARFALLKEIDGARTIGSYVDVSRFEAFRPYTFSVHSAVRFRLQNNAGFFLDASGGPTIWIPTQPNAETEWVVHHQVSVGHQGSDAEFVVGYDGLSVLTEKPAAVGELTIGELDLSIARARGRVRPTFRLLLPLDEEYSAVVGFVVGLGVAIRL